MWAQRGRHLRITGGQLRGRSVACPDGLDVRPTSSKVRQAFFNILGSRIDGALFLDLFAGSGLMGFEAISRGARGVTFVEENKAQATSIKKSSVIFKVPAEADVVISDVRRVWPHISVTGAKYDIVFADPPYKKGYGKQILAGLVEYKLLAPDSLVIIEHNRDDLIEVDDGSLMKVDYREYGKSALSFFSFD